MSTPTAFNGQQGTVTMGTSILSVTNWSADAEVEVLETTTVGSAGWQQNINGIEKIEGQFEMPVDSAAIQTGVAGWSPGTTGTLSLVLGNTGKAISGPARISKAAFKNESKGVVTFTCNFVSNGVWTLPS